MNGEHVLGTNLDGNNPSGTSTMQFNIINKIIECNQIDAINRLTASEEKHRTKLYYNISLIAGRVMN